MYQFHVSEMFQFRHLLFIDKNYHETVTSGDNFIFSLTKLIVIEVKGIILTKSSPRLGCVLGCVL